MPSPPYNLSVMPRTPVPAETMNWFKENAVFTEEQFKGKKILLFTNVNSATLDRIRPLNPDPIAPAPQNALNPAALPVLALVNKIFSGFLRTHYYPAFLNDEHMNGMAGDPIDVEYRQKKRVRQPRVPLKPRGTSSSTAAAREEDDDMQDGEDDVEEVEIPIGPGIKVALPSPRDITGWGGFDDLPDLPGVFFAYETDLTSFDTETVPNIVQRYFLGCLGSDVTTISAAMTKLREKWGVICRSEAGNVFSHMAKVIGIGLEAQARIFPVFDGEIYIGSVLGGGGFRVVNHGIIVHTKSAEVVKLEVEKCGAGRSILKAIGVVGEAIDDEDFQWSEGHVPITSMLGLRIAMRGWGLTEAQRDEIVKLSSRLTFPAVHWGMNPSTITRALDLIASSDDLPEDLPIHHTKLFSTDRLALVWSCFGLLAPSLNFRTGKTVRLDKGRVDSNITFTQAALEQAIADMKLVFSRKFAIIPAQERRSGPYKDLKFTGVDAQRIWNAMQNAAGVELGDQQVVGGLGAAGDGQVDVFGEW